MVKYEISVSELVNQLEEEWNTTELGILFSDLVEWTSKISREENNITKAINSAKKRALKYSIMIIKNIIKQKISVSCIKSMVKPNFS